MRIHATILALSATLLLAPNASAYQKPSGTFCINYNADSCYTTQPTDQYQLLVQSGMGRGWGYMNTGTRTHTIQPYGCYYMYNSVALWQAAGSPSSMRTCVYVGGDYVTHIFEQYPFPDIPQQDRDYFHPSAKMQIAQLWSGGQKISETMTLGSNQGSSISSYCSYYNANDENGSNLRGVALDRTPNSIMAACGFQIRQSQYVPPAPPATQNDDSDGSISDITIPQSAAQCGAVNNGSERVAVRAARHSCNQAKAVLRAYSRTMRSPNGWSCEASMNDSRFKARCSKKARGRAAVKAAVYGIWTRR